MFRFRFVSCVGSLVLFLCVGLAAHAENVAAPVAPKAPSSNAPQKPKGSTGESWLVLVAEGGQNSADGKPVAPGQDLPPGTTLRTGPGGRIKALHKAGAIAILSPSSQVVLGNPIDPTGSQLPAVLEGFTRWIFKKGNPSCAKNLCRVSTSNAVMGVRGTEFLLSYNGIFKETEVIGLEGYVDLGSRSNEGDFRTVSPGFWGGLGGRFGAQTGPLLRVPAAVLKQQKAAVTLPNPAKGPLNLVPQPAYYGEAVPAGY
jgi:hypothetical protein